MSEENIEVVRTAVDDFSRGDWDAAVLAFDPNVFPWYFVGSSLRVFRCFLRGAVPSPGWL
jgi:hypothetical protein